MIRMKTTKENSKGRILPSPELGLAFFLLLLPVLLLPAVLLLVPELLLLPRLLVFVPEDVLFRLFPLPSPDKMIPPY